MRTLFTLLACILYLPSLSVAEVETITVPLVDKSGTGSPFQVSGRFVLQESSQGNQLEWSWGQKVAIKNISDKPILMFVVTLSAVGPYPRGQHAAPGDAPTYVIEDDRFFTDDLIKPGESVTLRNTEPGSPTVGCCIDPLTKKSDPVAECHLRFVQFADGSIFGDAAEAQDALAMRGTILRGLRELNQSYAEHGEQSFAAKLKEQSPFSATVPFHQIITKYREGGAPSAIDAARHLLNTAEKHRAEMKENVSGGSDRAPLSSPRSPVRPVLAQRGGSPVLA